MIKVKYTPESDMIPIKLWLDDIEVGAMKQIENLSQLPFAFHHISIMPDCHQGYGMPIGGVLATEGVIIPNAVGVDIGCGMCAVMTSIKADQLDKETLKKIFGGSKEYQGGIRTSIPVGFGHHSKKQDKSLMPKGEVDWVFDSLQYPIIHKEYESALTQLGTLGGGNHFIEIQKDTDDNVWIMIHSGSRNLGFKVAKYYNDLAINLNERWRSQVPKEWELAFLPIETQEAKDYMREMNYCVDFALANRKLMMTRICEVIQEIFKNTNGIVFGDLNKLESDINIAHNYARWENHFGKNVMIHRKGATSARAGEIGIIPGSQGTKSYIVKGLGNPESFMSCSHGAGRKMSRTKAQNELKLEDEIKKLDDQGIMHGIRHKNDLDEASGAYKDISEVINNQSDLIEIVAELSPIAVMKG